MRDAVVCAIGFVSACVGLVLVFGLGAALIVGGTVLFVGGGLASARR